MISYIFVKLADLPARLYVYLFKAVKRTIYPSLPIPMFKGVKKRNRINKLVKEDGVVVEEEREIHGLVTNFYKNLFSS